MTTYVIGFFGTDAQVSGEVLAADSKVYSNIRNYMTKPGRDVAGIFVNVSTHLSEQLPRVTVLSREPPYIRALAGITNEDRLVIVAHGDEEKNEVAGLSANKLALWLKVWGLEHVDRIFLAACEMGMTPYATELLRELTPQVHTKVSAPAGFFHFDETGNRRVFADKNKNVEITSEHKFVAAK